MPKVERSPLPWTRFSYDDFLDDPAVERMGDSLIGPYLRLLRAAWKASLQGWRPGYIPSDPAYLAAVSRLANAWQVSGKLLANAFDVSTDPEWWIQRRIVREYAEADALSKVRSVAGTEGRARQLLGKSRAIAPQTLDVRRKTLDGETEPRVKTSCAEPPKNPALPAAFNFRATDGEAPISQEQVASWRSTFPGCDIFAELRKAAAWQDANPTKRKTRRGMNRFAFSWLSRAQNSQTASNGHTPEKPRPVPPYLARIIE